MSIDDIVADTVKQGRDHVLAQILYRNRYIAQQAPVLERERAIVEALKATFPVWMEP